MKTRLATVSLFLFLLAATSIATAWLFFWNNEPAADFTAIEFHEEYKDGKAANQRYVGQSLTIRGEVIDVGFYMGTTYGSKAVALGKPDAGVLCYFHPTKVHQAERLVPGQQVVIRGVSKGEFNGVPHLYDCVVEYEGYWPLGKVIGN